MTSQTYPKPLFAVLLSFLTVVMMTILTACSPSVSANGSQSQAQKTEQEPTRHSQPLKIGIIGAGQVGSTLGRIWVSAGHDVMFSARNVEKVKSEFKDLGDKARYGSASEAVKYGDVVLLAVPYTSAIDVVSEHKEALKGKIVIDAMNLWRQADQVMWEPVNKEAGGNMAVFIAQRLPESRMVRTFNATDMYQVQRSYERGGKNPLIMPLTSDDAEAVKVVEILINDTHTKMLNVGKLAEAYRFQPGTAWTLHTTDENEARQRLGLQ